MVTWTQCLRCAYIEDHVDMTLVSHPHLICASLVFLLTHLVWFQDQSTGAASHPYDYYDQPSKDKDCFRVKSKPGMLKGESTQPGRTDLSLNKGKFAPITVFKPKNLTFNFIKSGYRPQNRQRISLGGRSADTNKPIIHTLVMDFLDFVILFKSFSLRCRKDLKDLFEQFATSKPSIERKLSKSEFDREPPISDSGKWRK